MMKRCFLDIADVGIHITSDEDLYIAPQRRQKIQTFLHTSLKNSPPIVVEVRIVDKLTPADKGELFSATMGTQSIDTYCYVGEDGEENIEKGHLLENATLDVDSSPSWKLFEDGEGFIFERYQLGSFTQSATINSMFDKACINFDREFLQTNKTFSDRVDIDELLLPFLYVLFANYLVFHGGLMVHSAGIHHDGKGLLFIGNSGSGKSTISLFWARKYGADSVLNDDRVAVRKFGDRFSIYKTPWFGSIAGYQTGKILGAELDRIFFLNRQREHEIKDISKRNAMLKIIPNIAIPFWEKGICEQSIAFCEGLLEKVARAELYAAKRQDVVEVIESIL